jgi:hypothetical protein
VPPAPAPQSFVAWPPSWRCHGTRRTTADARRSAPAVAAAAFPLYAALDHLCCSREDGADHSGNSTRDNQDLDWHQEDERHGDFEQQVEGSANHRRGANPQRLNSGDVRPPQHGGPWERRRSRAGTTTSTSTEAAATATSATTATLCPCLIHAAARLHTEHSTTDLWVSAPPTCKDMTTTGGGRQ